MSTSKRQLKLSVALKSTRFTPQVPLPLVSDNYLQVLKTNHNSCFIPPRPHLKPKQVLSILQLKYILNPAFLFTFITSTLDQATKSIVCRLLQ